MWVHGKSRLGRWAPIAPWQNHVQKLYLLGLIRPRVQSQSLEKGPHGDAKT